MIISFNRTFCQIIVFIAFCYWVLFCRYQKNGDVGDYIIVAEGILFFIALILRGKEDWNIGVAFFLYIIFIITREIENYYLIGDIEGEAKITIYSELGVAVLFAVLITDALKEKIYILMRNFGALSAFFGCLEFVFKSSWISQFITVKGHRYSLVNMGTDKWRVRTFFLHPVICAVFMIITWILVLYIPYRKKWLQYIVQGFIVMCLIGTKSRSSWISFVVVTILFCVLKSGKNKAEIGRDFIYKWIVVIFLTILICMFFGNWIEMLSNTVSSRLLSGLDGNNEGNYNRVMMIRVGANVFANASIRNKIIGYGSDYAINYLRMHPIRGWNGAVDNTFVTVLLNYGLVGLALHMSIFLISIKNAIKSKSKIVEMSALAVISLFISGFFYEMYSWFTTTICLSVFLLGQSKMGKYSTKVRFVT